MKIFVIILFCLSAKAFGNPGEILEYFQNGQRSCRLNCRQTNPFTACPPTNCPPPNRDPNCGSPNCNYEPNRAFHHPHQNPNFYWTCQMADGSRQNWRAVEMSCACGTFFWSPANRCVHPHEWSPETFCIGSQPNNPTLRECNDPPDCPTCPSNGPPGPIEIESPPGIPIIPPNDDETTPSLLPTTTSAPPVCPCICTPCIFWPCLPCATNCSCQQRQNPWNTPRQQNRRIILNQSYPGITKFSQTP